MARADGGGPASARVLLVALGNPLRRDDGVAEAVLQALPERAGLARVTTLQPLPELATAMTGLAHVVFVDADVSGAPTAVVPLPEAAAAAPLGHRTAPGEVVALARALYGFAGRAWACRVTVCDLGAGTGLSDQARAGARDAVARLGPLLDRWLADEPAPQDPEVTP